MAPSQKSSSSLPSGRDVQNTPALGSCSSSVIAPSRILSSTLSSSQQPVTPFPSARWSELPNELLVKILPHLVHQDLVHFAATCKWLHGLARVALQEHQDLMQQWSSRTNHVIRRSFTRLYRSIIDDPLRALYVRKLEIWQSNTFSYIYSYPTTPDDISEINLTVQEAERGDFGDFIENHPLYTGKIVQRSLDQDWLMHSLRNGDEMPTAVFLCSLLPNLNSLIFRCDSAATGRGLF